LIPVLPRLLYLPTFLSGGASERADVRPLSLAKGSDYC